MKPKLIRITTVPLSFEKLLTGQLHFMQQYYDTTAISSEKERLEKFGDSQGIKTYYIELTRQITLLKDLKALWYLYWYLKKEKPAIVHTHTPKAGIVGMLAAKLAGVPVRLHTVAGLPLLETSGLKRKVLNFVEKLTYSCSTQVYPNSLGLKDIILQEKFCPSSKLKTLANGSSNGIDTNCFDPALFSDSKKDKLKQSLNINNDAFVYIFVGRMVKDKGINELISAFLHLQQQSQSTKLLLVGPFEDELDPLDSKTKLEIQENKNIIFVGYQSEIRPYLSIANALVFPSYREGFPNVVMQAGAMNLPSIVTNINGCNEIIVNKENGLIIPTKDVALLQQAMQFILEHPEETNRMAEKSRSMIVSRYEQHVVWDAILNEYNSLTENI